MAKPDDSTTIIRKRRYGALVLIEIATPAHSIYKIALGNRKARRVPRAYFYSLTR